MVKVQGIQIALTSLVVLPPVLQLEIKTPFLNYSWCLLLSYSLSIQRAKLLLLKATKSAVAQWRTEIAVTIIPFPSAYAAKQIIHPDSLNVSKRMLKWYFTHFQEVRYRCSPFAAEFVRSNDREGTPCCTLPLDFCSEENTSFIFYMPQSHTTLLYTAILVLC